MKTSTPQGAFPSRFPIDINENLWLYENEGSITVVIGNTNAPPTRVPLKTLCVIVDRYRGFRAKRRKK